METEKQIPFYQTTTAKIIMVGLLALFLLIPLSYVQSLITERANRKQNVVTEVTESWGTDVHIYGPILKVPYKIYITTTLLNPTNNKQEISTTQSIDHAYFFPEKADFKTTIQKDSSLKRGLYNVVVFSTDINVQGAFSKPNFKKLQIDEANVMWDQASILVKTTNLKSSKGDLNLKVGDTTLTFESRANSDKYFDNLESEVFAVKDLENLPFKFQMKYNGSNSVKFTPVGKSTTVSIDSDWQNPSFEGIFSANTKSKSITENGFHADWTVSQVNRPFSQEYTETLPQLDEYLFGVKLIETVDQYQQNERASKYGFLMIGLTFLIFFLIQTISKISIHIFQYGMIGLALVLFYTLLISITEHSTFSIAYATATFAVIAMLFLYTLSILKSMKFSLFIGLALASLYTFIYVIIQLENYALLVGSIGLFLILGIVMYFSRKIDWEMK
ncbi:cell envelope integrity protein CreD [Flavobacterium tegetincola]|uniref:cell envelope integrity protein CreD n=1 Tax=Flavobacterium tegetincola TaxID=150172 RepID=UPI000424C8EE|nr:cell envelope integrity protein CreD [Flavobacterium tegetincola]